jgi:hypothetical protein
MTESYRASRVPIPTTAFSRDLRSRKKRPRQEMRDHLKFISLARGNLGVQAGEEARPLFRA